VTTKTVPSRPAHAEPGPKEVLAYLKAGCEITTRPWVLDARIQAGVCQMCGHRNEGGETSCVECGGQVPVPAILRAPRNGYETILHYGVFAHTPGHWEHPMEPGVLRLLLETGLVRHDSGNEHTGEDHYKGDFGLAKIPLMEIPVCPVTGLAGEEKIEEGATA